MQKPRSVKENDKEKRGEVQILMDWKRMDIREFKF
jgi:hypothetical protein